MTASLRWLALLLLAGCAHPAARTERPARPPAPAPSAEATARSDEIDVLQRQIDRLGKGYTDLAANFALHACNQDLRVVLSKLFAECDARLARKRESRSVRVASTAPITAKGTGKPPSRPVDALTACPTAYVQPRLIDLEESLGVNVAKILNDTPHEVIYFADDVGSMGGERKQRLQELVSVPFMASSKLLLITAADRADEDADRRIDWTLNWLLNEGVPQSKVARPLKYHLVVPAGELRPRDKPELLEPRDLSRALWVFRISC